MTEVTSTSPSHVRSALFVDFDNIYLGLQNEDPRAAEQFATHPGRWLSWLQESLTCEPVGETARRRRKILLRRCYLNPSQFSRFRPYFIRSAFEVVDCPPLTRGGKTSADIQMVMDVMDALGHATRFEEFIILSGDADFTPVLLRLSKHDRRSVVLAAGPASAAYKAACDLLIDQDTFLDEAIGLTDGAAGRPEGPNPELLDRIASTVHERAAVSGELVATDLPAIFREFPEFTPDSNWLGFYSLRGMANAVVRSRKDLTMVDGDPWRVRIRVLTDAEASAPAEPAPAAEEGSRNTRMSFQLPSTPGSGTASPELLSRIADKIYERASASGELVATDLPAIYRDFPEFTPTSNWLGFYSLRGLSNAVLKSRKDLTMVDGDPWRVRVHAAIEPAETPRETAHEEEEPAVSEAVAPATLVDRSEMIEQIIDYVRNMTEDSDSAIPMARAAQMVIGRFGSEVLTTRWAGAGTFRDLLMGRESPGFTLSEVRPGYIYDPDRHQMPAEGLSDEAEIGDPEISSLAHRVHRLTDTPFLTPAEYARVFRMIAQEVNEEGYFLTRTSKAVRDRCIEEGDPIARASVNFVLRGITSTGHRFDPNGGNDPVALGSAFSKNVLGLCESAGLPLSEQESETLNEWILGDLVKQMQAA
ncbi:MAG: NYN domain-containing protein [Acidobacteriota bacterium]|nr:NYN domain-containing protein [Acidobacteriota bacterium]